MKTISCLIYITTVFIGVCLGLLTSQSTAWLCDVSPFTASRPRRTQRGNSMIVFLQTDRPQADFEAGPPSRAELDSSEEKGLQLQRQGALELLDRIAHLKKELGTQRAETEATAVELESFDTQVAHLEDQIQDLEAAMVIPPRGLTIEEYQSAIVLFLQLPYPYRAAFCEALELGNSKLAATDLKQIPVIVSLLYEQRVQLTPKRLREALQKVQQGALPRSFGSPEDTNDRSMLPPPLQGLFKERDEESGGHVKTLLGSVTRKEGREATQQDLDRLLQVLAKNDDFFQVTNTETIPGGYVLRGTNLQKSGRELVALLDDKLPAQDFDAQVSLMDDVTSADVFGSEPVLVLLHKDFSPRVSGILTALCSVVTLTLIFLFSAGVYNSNDAVTAQLSDAQSILDGQGISLFTDRVLDVLLPLLCIQVWHELAHYVVAKLNRMQMGFPTLLPFWSGLPFYGTKTNLITSPPNRSVLLDFGIAGPLVGMLSSLGCLAVGLLLTATADASQLQYFPSLPVSLLQTSTLAGSMADYVLGGGMVGVQNRLVTLQDPSANVILHPGAVAGVCGVLVHSLALLPLGSSDGGRVSLAIFGRNGHGVVGAIVWASLLVASLTSERPEVLIAAWLVNNIVENDMEIPCREETDKVDFSRVLVAVSAWLVAFLAVLPLAGT